MSAYTKAAALAAWNSDPDARKAVIDLRISKIGIDLACGVLVGRDADALFSVWGTAHEETIGLLHDTLIAAGWPEGEAYEASEEAWDLDTNLFEELNNKLVEGALDGLPPTTT